MIPNISLLVQARSLLSTKMGQTVKYTDSVYTNVENLASRYICQMCMTNVSMAQDTVGGLPVSQDGLGRMGPVIVSPFQSSHQVEKIYILANMRSRVHQP